MGDLEEPMLADDKTMAHSALCSTFDERPRTQAGHAILASGCSFARYRISRCIGAGGMGTVYEAEHTLLRKRVALKTMHGPRGRDQHVRDRFLREAEIVARIRHPNVVDITDVGVEQGIPFLVMELLEGEDLAALLAREGPLTAQQAVDLLLPITAGLAAAHRLGIVHRDVKPENVFMAEDALGDLVVKVVDFGVSKDLNEASARERRRGAGSHAEPQDACHTVVGTPYYMAPEQLRGSALLDARTDQYALGVLLYQCLTGVWPFEGASLLELAYRIDSGACRPVRELRPDLQEELASIVARAMAGRIEDRFPSTEVFGQALSALASPHVRQTYARDFAPERRSSVPPPRRSDAPSLRGAHAGWIRVDGLSGSQRRARTDEPDRRASVRGALLRRTIQRAAVILAATLLLPHVANDRPAEAPVEGAAAATGVLPTPQPEVWATSLSAFQVARVCAVPRLR
jgi:serine/threonine protein kinase